MMKLTQNFLASKRARNLQKCVNLTLGNQTQGKGLEKQKININSPVNDSNILIFAPIEVTNFTGNITEGEGRNFSKIESSPGNFTNGNVTTNFNGNSIEVQSSQINATFVAINVTKLELLETQQEGPGNQTSRTLISESLNNQTQGGNLTSQNKKIEGRNQTQENRTEKRNQTESGNQTSPTFRLESPNKETKRRNQKAPNNQTEGGNQTETEVGNQTSSNNQTEGGEGNHTDAAKNLTGTDNDIFGRIITSPKIRLNIINNITSPQEVPSMQEKNLSKTNLSKEEPQLNVDDNTGFNKSEPVKPYKVKQGDTLSGIAQKNNMTLEHLLAIPGNKKFKNNPDFIMPNQEVMLASPKIDQAQTKKDQKNETSATGIAKVTLRNSSFLQLEYYYPSFLK